FEAARRESHNFLPILVDLSDAEYRIIAYLLLGRTHTGRRAVSRTRFLLSALTPSPLRDPTSSSHSPRFGWVRAVVLGRFSFLPLTGVSRGPQLVFIPPVSVHADRVAGRDRDHRDPDRPAPPRRPEGPRGRRTHEVRQQPQADRHRHPRPRERDRIPAVVPRRPVRPRHLLRHHLRRVD